MKDMPPLTEDSIIFTADRQAVGKVGGQAQTWLCIMCFSDWHSGWIPVPFIAYYHQQFPSLVLAHHSSCCAFPSWNFSPNLLFSWEGWGSDVWVFYLSDPSSGWWKFPLLAVHLLHSPAQSHYSGLGLGIINMSLKTTSLRCPIIWVLMSKLMHKNQATRSSV